MTIDNQTRLKLIEVAGAVFSEKGYDGATAREVCLKAGVNPASVNYYFGGKERLYVEVLREAHRRMTNLVVLNAILAEERAPAEKLERFIAHFTAAVFDSGGKAWETKLIVRELTSPTKALAEVVDVQVRPVARMIRELAGRYMELPTDHPAVFLGAMSIMAQFLFLLQNRAVIRLLFPEFERLDEAPHILEKHIHGFVEAGLKAVASSAGKESPSRPQFR